MLTKEQYQARYGAFGPTHPGRLLEAYGVPPTFEHPELQYLITAQGLAPAAWKEIYDANERVMRNSALTAGQQVKAMADGARQKMDSTLALLDVAIQRAEKQMQHVEIRERAALWPKDAHDEALAVELRAYLRSLNEGERDKVLKPMLRGRDAALVRSAIASAPAVLSGVHPAKHDEVRAMHLAVRDPELIELRAGLEGGTPLLTKASETLRADVYDFVDFSAAEDLKALER